MGFWNETCGITNLPIRYGDKVKLFVLEQQHSGRHVGGGTCYINEVWAPIGPPITGSYNDYGSIENIVKSPANKFLEEAIKEKLLPFDEEELDGFMDKVVPAKDMGLEDLILTVERGLAKTNNAHGETVSLGIMFVLDEVYQSLLTYNPVETERLKQGGYIYAPYKEILARQVENWYTKRLARFQELKVENQNKDDVLSKFRADFYLDTDDGDMLFWDYRDHNIRLVKVKLQDCMRKGLTWNDSKVQNLSTMMMEMFLVKNAMEAARKFWSPQTGKGGQHGELDIYKLINKTSEKIIQKREEDAIDDEAEVPDENGYYSYMLEHNEAQRLNDNES